MIRLTRINHEPMLLNSDLIEHVEITPDTVISLTTGSKFVVLESADELLRRVIEFRREICDPTVRMQADPDEAVEAAGDELTESEPGN